MISPQQYNNVYLPKWISDRVMQIYIVALLVVTAVYFSFSMPWYYLLFGVATVISFFYYSNSLSRQWQVNHITSDRSFEKKIFWISFVVRLFYMTFIYVIFQIEYGDPFGFEYGDACFYDFAAGNVSFSLYNGDIRDALKTFDEVDISDTGYAMYLGVVYLLTDNSIYISRVIKCILSAWTVVMVFRVAKMNFGTEIARLAALFCMLWPNFWYYCGTSLKETEMVFLSVLFVLQADSLLRTNNFSIWRLVPLLLISATLFTFRSVLAILTVLCLLFSIVMSSSKAVGWGKRIMIGFVAVLMIGVTVGDVIMREASELTETVQSTKQENNMQWRSVRKDGNSFAKYAGKAVFAPLIFSIPFPTMVKPFEGQDVQQMLNGGNYVKNILSFFVILSMFMLLFSGHWRRYLVPLSFMLGYMVILALSEFAQSERFHQPAMPFEFIFAAYGISQVLNGVPVYKRVGGRVQYKQWFNYWMAFIFVVCIGWNWFKLAGRGLV